MSSITKKQVLEFLSKTPFIALATTDSKGHPYNTPMLFIIDEELNFYFATHRKSNKSKNILARPDISITAGFHDDLNVQVQAKAHELTDEKEIDDTINELIAKAATVHKFWPPVLRLHDEDYIIFKGKPNSLKAFDPTSVKISVEGELFTQLI